MFFGLRCPWARISADPAGREAWTRATEAAREKVELVLDFFAGFGGDAAAFGPGLLFFEVGLAVSFIGEVALALEAAGGKAGEAVEHTDEVEGVGLASGADGVGADIGNGLADHAGSDFARGLETGDAFEIACEIQGEFLAGAAALDAALFHEPVLVAACFPVGNILNIEGFAPVTELLDDFFVGKAVFEHFVELVTDGFGEAGDFAGTGSIFDFWFLIFEFGLF
jgi:hypothetical protein